MTNHSLAPCEPGDQELLEEDTDTPVSSDHTSAIESKRPHRWRKLGFLVMLLAAAAVGFHYQDLLSLRSLADHEGVLRQSLNTNPWFVIAVAFAAYVMLIGLSVPGATAFSLFLGWYLGFWRALITVSFASSIGATLAFLASRYLLGDLAQKLGRTQLSKFRRQWESDGAYFLFSLRLLPVVPFFLVNIIMGLTPIRTRTFYWVSQLGMLPGTALYIYAGSTMPSVDALIERGIFAIFSWRLLIAFVLLGMFPLLMKKLISNRK